MVSPRLTNMQPNKITMVDCEDGTYDIQVNGERALYKGTVEMDGIEYRSFVASDRVILVNADDPTDAQQRGIRSRAWRPAVISGTEPA